MSATISTQPRQRMPLAASLAVAGVIAAAGALGFAWQQSSDSTAPTQAPTLRTPTAQDYSQYNYYHGARPWGGLDGHVPPAPPAQGDGGVDGQTQPAPTTSGGRVQTGL
jgi:hypothetical protein